MMHLTTDEILNFITFNSITQESVALAAKVNCHIMQCDECRKKVEAFQAINDKMSETILSNPELSKNSIDKNDPNKGFEI